MPATVTRSGGYDRVPAPARLDSPQTPLAGRAVRSRMPTVNRRFALLQVVFSLIALAAVVWWASHQEAPSSRHSRRGARLARRGGAAVRAGHAGPRRALAPDPRAHRRSRPRAPTATASRRGLHGQQRASRPRGRGAAGGAARPAARDAGKRKHAAGTIVAERMLDVIVLAVMLVVIAYGVLPETTSLPTDRPILITGVASGAGCWCWPWCCRSCATAALLTRLRDLIRAAGRRAARAGWAARACRCWP